MVIYIDDGCAAQPKAASSEQYLMESSLTIDVAVLVPTAKMKSLLLRVLSIKMC